MGRELTAWLCWFEGDDLPVTILADSEETAAETFAEVRGAGIVRVASAVAAHAALAAAFMPGRAQRRAHANDAAVRGLRGDLEAAELKWIAIKVAVRAHYTYHGVRL